MTTDSRHLPAVAGQFKLPGRLAGLREYGCGNINKTFLVTVDTDKNQEQKFIMQQLNTRVFSRPAWIMANLRLVADHVRARLQNDRGVAGRRWELPAVIEARDGKDYFVEADGSFWRVLSFIDQAVVYEKIESPEVAHEAGRALGIFHKLLCGLPADRLFETLPGFHITPLYLAQLEAVINLDNPGRSRPEVEFCLAFVKARRGLAATLENAKKERKLVRRPIHGDPKISNIMFDAATGRAVALIDLDTVQAGLVHYDLGDCLRSCCNPAGEEVGDPAEVHFDTGLCRVILEGYLAEAASFLSRYDYFFLYEAIRLIAFELGLRYLTDYLRGNSYFKVRHAEHNLGRALGQFRLTESIEAQEDVIRALIKDLTPARLKF